MERTLWENEQTRVWMVEGTPSNLNIEFIEPEGIDYDLRVGFGRKAYRRGAMYGNTFFNETHDTFYGSVKYNRITLTNKYRQDVTMPDVIAIKKFQRFLYVSNMCSLYLISAKTTGESTLILALKTKDHLVHDLEGVGSLVDTAVTSLKKQIKFSGIPAIFSAGFIFTFIVVAMGSLFGKLVIFGSGLIFPLLLPFFIAGGILFKKKLYQYPTKNILADILKKEGFTVSMGI